MTIRLTVSIMLLLIIPITGITTLIYVRTSCDDIVYEISKAAENYDIQNMLNIQKKWKNITFFLSIIIPHGHLDEISESIDRAIMFLKFDTKDEFSAEISKTIGNIEIIKNYDYPSIRSIF